MSPDKKDPKKPNPDEQKMKDGQKKPDGSTQDRKGGMEKREDQDRKDQKKDSAAPRDRGPGKQ